MIKISAINMSYDITDTEKMRAEKALMCFDHDIKALDLAYDHLNIMKTPFKNNSSMTPEDVMKARVAMRRYRDQAVENFNKFKQVSFQCVNAMQPFTSDTQTVKLLKSYINSINELENKVNNFVALFDDLKNTNFATDIVKNIDGIQEQCDEIEEIIEERIKNHIKDNILSINWVNNTAKELNLQLENKKPLIEELMEQRQDQLNNVIKERNS